VGSPARARGPRRSAPLVLAALAALAAAGIGCQKRSPAIEYMPNMAYGPRVNAQDEDPLRPGYSAQRTPVPGTVPRDFTPYRYAQLDTAHVGEELENPLPRTTEVILRGQRVYANTCVVCHGPKGDGQGYIVPIYPMPPQLYSDKVRRWTDGRLFHVITRGQNLMPSYASQIVPGDRWAVVHYVRALQRAAHPLPGDLAPKAGADSSAADTSAAHAASTAPAAPHAASPTR
jgi:mono/diheme cytochrome c family protein